MTQVAIERPAFFEGQFLGAEDLTALVDYFRTQAARHSLGAHTWGIAAGLELLEREAPDGTLEVVLTPGFAVDGYGRLLVVLSAEALSTELFAGQDTGEVKVWLRFDAQELQGVRRGFEVCSTDDVFSRISEGYAVEAGTRSAIIERQSGVVVNDEALTDAREALRSVDESAPLICDASIPYQAFPAESDEARWLVPLGIVHWVAAASGFQALSEEQRVRSRIGRRYMGAVAETIQAANGVIRLRDRRTPFDAAKTSDELCADSSLKPVDLRVCDDQVRIDDLIWLEGNTRLTGHARLWGRRLEFRDAEGRDYVERTVQGVNLPAIAPLLLERLDDNELEGADLDVALGQSEDGRNRLTISQVQADGDPCDVTLTRVERVAIQDNGRVGIGTFNPVSELGAPLTIRGEGEQGELLAYEDPAGNVQWRLNLGESSDSLNFAEATAGDDGDGRLYLRAGGNVGIGTVQPEARLDIANAPVTTNGSPLGTDLWLRVGDGGDNGRVWIEYGPEAAPLLVLSDRDDPPRIQFQQTASTDPEDDDSPAHVSWFGHAGGGSPDLAIMGGQLGINTDDVYTDLTLDGSLGFKNGTEPQIFMFESGVSNPDRMVLSHSPGFPDWGLAYQDVGDRFVFQSAASSPALSVALGSDPRVGIGTNSPNAPLDVRGDVRLGASGELFAAAGVENLRIIVGQVSTTGLVQQGSGYSISKGAAGHYTVNFNQSFSGSPVVVATVMGDADNVITVASVTSSSCTLRIFDVEESAGASAPVGDDDAPFMFIAIGER